MEFRIGPWTYSVHIGDGALFDDDGAEQAGRCVWTSHTIELSGTLPLNRRLEVLLHELRHAWVYTVGRVSGEEDDANNAASFTATCMRELLAQGGEPALRRMRPAGCEDADVNIALWDDTGEASSASCGKCESMVAAGSIISSPPEYDPRYRRLVLIRGFWCDGCGHLQRWREGCTQTGLPNGQVIGEPEYVTGEPATEFMRANAERLGVVVK